MQASPKEVVAAYSDFLARESRASVWLDTPCLSTSSQPTQTADPACEQQALGLPRILAAKVSAGTDSLLRSGLDSLDVQVTVQTSIDYAMPSLGVVVLNDGQSNICSAGTHIDQFQSQTPPGSKVTLRLTWPAMALLKGRYHVDLFLLCEKGVHVYEHIRQVSSFEVTQTHLEVGVVTLPHSWKEVPP